MMRLLPLLLLLACAPAASSAPDAADEGRATPFDAGGPYPPDSPLPGYPQAIAGGALEQMCLRAVSCFPKATILFPDCLRYWQHVLDGDPATDGAYRRFLATPVDSGCEGFATTFGELPFRDPSLTWCETRCVGNVATDRCANGWPKADAPVISDCGLGGLTCEEGRCVSGDPTTGPCNACTDGHAISCDGSGRVVGALDCGARGLSCVLRSGQAFCSPGTCASSGCQGDVAVSCVNGLVADRLDCARIGATCDATKVACVAKHWAGADPIGLECDGRYLIFAVAGQVRYVDCESAGFSRCEHVQQGDVERAYCVR